MRAAEPVDGSFEALPVDQPWPGVRRRSFDTERATVTAYEFEPDARFPIHSHPQEQITLVQQGEVDFSVGGQVKRLGPGDWSVVPPGVEHGLRAGDSGAQFLAIIVPRRESPNAYTLSGDEPR
jgi:quercetin dioxygenase-like cupin family protein